MLIDGTIRLYAIEEFSKRYNLSNVGKIRLHVNKTLSSNLNLLYIISIISYVYTVMNFEI